MEIWFDDSIEVQGLEMIWRLTFMKFDGRLRSNGIRESGYLSNMMIETC